MAVVSVVDKKVVFLNSLGYTGGLVEMETQYYRDLSGLVEQNASLSDAYFNTLGDIGCLQNNLHDRIICRYTGSPSSPLSIYDLETIALDSGDWGVNFTAEADRFLPPNLGHNIVNGFAYGAGSKARDPDTGRGAQGAADGTGHIAWPNGTHNIYGTGSMWIYWRGTVKDLGDTNAMFSQGFTGASTKEGFAGFFNVDNTMQFGVREQFTEGGDSFNAVTTTTVSLDDEVAILGEVVYNDKVHLSFRLNKGAVVYREGSSADLPGDLDYTNTDSEPFKIGEGSSLAGLSSININTEYAIKGGTLTQAQVEAILNGQSLEKLAPDDSAIAMGFGTIMRSTTVGGVDGTHGATVVNFSGPTTPSVANEIGYSESSDFANEKMPLLVDRVTPAYNINVTDIFLGRVAQQVKLKNMANRELNGTSYLPVTLSSPILINEGQTFHLKANRTTGNTDFIWLLETSGGAVVRIGQNSGTSSFRVLVNDNSGTLAIIYDWDLLGTATDIEYEIVLNQNAGAGLKVTAASRTSPTAVFVALTPAATPFPTDTGTSDILSVNRMSFGASFTGSSAFTGSIWDFELDGILNFPMQEQSTKSYNVLEGRTESGTWVGSTVGRTDFSNAHNLKHGANNVDDEFVPSVIDSNGNSTGIDVLGNALVSNGVIDTGFTIDLNPFATHELNEADAAISGAALVPDLPDNKFTVMDRTLEREHFRNLTLFRVDQSLAGNEAALNRIKQYAHEALKMPTFNIRVFDGSDPQLTNVIAEIDFYTPDIILFQEVTAAGNVLLNTPMVTRGYLHKINAVTSLQIATYYKSAFYDVVSFEILTSFLKTDGRFPLKIVFKNKFTNEEFVVYNVHYDDDLDTTGNANRLSTSEDLVAHANTNHPGGRIIIAGDFNDKIDVARFDGSVDTPLRPFFTGGYTAGTVDNSDASDITFGSIAIDHLFTKNIRFGANYADGDKQVDRNSSFLTETSDHFLKQFTIKI